MSAALESNSRKPYIVLFGPQNAGKSTLAGYLYLRWLEKEKGKEARLNFEEKIKQETGLYYSNANRFSLVVDKALDEIRHSGDGDGTSKMIHFSQIGDISVIDTPGASSQRKERYKGIFMGEVGIFLIELEVVEELLNSDPNEVEYSRLFNLFFGPYFMWKKLNPDNSSIVMLTKIDNVHFDRDHINNTISKVKDLLEIEKVIPMYIDVKSSDDSLCDEGLTKSSRYSNQCLMDYINTLDDIHRVSSKKDLFMVNDRRYPHVPGVGMVLRWKILAGSIAVGDKIRISPVLFNDQINTITAKVKTMRNIHKQALPANFEVSVGEVVSIALTDIRIAEKNKRVDKEDIKFVKTSIVVSDREKILFGNSVVLRIEDEDQLDLINEGTDVELAWYGRMLAAGCIDKKIDENGCCIMKLNLLGKVWIAIPECRRGEEKCIVLCRKKETDFDSVTYRAVIMGIDHDL